MKIFFPLALLLILGMTISCKKNAVTPAVTKTDNISTGAWKIENVGPDQNRDGTIDASALSLFPDCTKDNSITFKRDNTGITDEGATKCMTTDPQTSVFNWTFADAEANINVSNSAFAPLNSKSKILELTSATLSLTKDTIIFGSNTAFIVRLKH